MAEDREQFDAALARLGVARPQGKAARSFREARAIARELGFPVLVRPSFVLGGRGDGDRATTKANSPRTRSRRRRFSPTRRCSSTSICADSKSKSTRSSTARISSFPGSSSTSSAPAFTPATRSASIPTQTIDAAMEQRIVEVTHAIARELGIRGLINIQFVIHEGALYIIEANPRASRTVPIISKGDRHQHRRRRDAHRARREAARHGVRNRLASARPVRRRQSSGVLVLEDARRRNDPRSGDEIDRRSAGHRRRRLPARCSRVSSAPAFACRAAAAASSSRSPTRRSRNRSPILRRYAELGHTLVATPGTRAVLERPASRPRAINKIADGSPHVLDLIHSRRVDLVINDAKGPREISDNYKIRRAAVEAGIACLTSLDTARALAEALASTAGPAAELARVSAAAQRAIERR